MPALTVRSTDFRHSEKRDLTVGWALHEKASDGSLLYVGGSTSILGIAEQFFKPSVYEPFWKSRGLKVKRECNGSLAVD